MVARINWRQLEKKWQRKWAWVKVHETDPKRGKPKYFVTAAYPYPNSPQHIGHARTYTLADVNARFHRMTGYNTLFPMGFHYTGTPLFAMSKRVSQNDPDTVDTFTRIYGIPVSKLDALKDPKSMASYFREDIKKGMLEMGFSIDWRREFTTIDPLYNRYIEWHFQKLSRKGLITQGTHPVAWCPNDKSPVGTVDTLGDVDPEIGESYLVKFQSDGVYYPTATLRPETVFGVTNIWVNPDVPYVRANVDGEPWITSKKAVEKLQHQNHRAQIEQEVRPKELLWKTVRNPATNAQIPILPGDFVEADNGTGVVMSVPGHAPYDYQALTDLKSRPPAGDEEGQLLKTIEPVSIIRLEGFSDVPAADMVKKFNVRNQKDPELEEATRELYSKEYHNGTMKENTGPYAGMPVAKARDAVAQDLTKDGKVTRLYELLNAPVICRCGTACLVHIMENQWFINYGDPEWKKLAHQCLGQMLILPEELRREFNYTLDWLREKACARTIGLGTRLPWDHKWVIEALSDSVVYMAYYVLAKYFTRDWVVFRKFEKNPSKLPDAFFNFVLLGEGSLIELAEKTRIPKRILNALREEFQYFYPVDMRHSARDLISNHLSFYVFHHAALFPSSQWPKGIVVNGFVLMEGAKMSKSLENIIPLRQAIAKFGTDPVRIGVMSTAELNQDTDFSEPLVVSIQERLSSMISQAKKLRGAKLKPKVYSKLDRWMLGRLNEVVRTATESMEKLRVREVINKAMYQVDNDLGWYQRRLGPRKKKGDTRASVLRRVLETRARLLAPIAPHTAEEVWSLLGNRGLVAKAVWPEEEERLRDRGAEQAELLVRGALEDTSEILKTTGLSPKHVVYYTAAGWKWRVYRKALEAASKQGVPSDLIREAMSDPELRKLGKAVADYAGKVAQQARQTPEELRKARLEAGEVSEKTVLEEASEFLGRELRAEVDVWREDDGEMYDPKGRARMAEPYRPAIFVE